MEPHAAIVAIARVCHEANRAWCSSQGDYSQPVWDEAENWRRESAIRGVSVALAGATPETQHEAWTQDKLAEGWKYGPVKDAEAKTHPCLVAYDELPKDQQAKDALFGAIVRALAPSLGLA
jgi:RyR domain